MMGYPGYGYGDGSWIGMVLMMFLGVVFLVGLVLLIVWLARGGGYNAPGMGSMGGASGTSSACDIAKVRYAKGEITKEQYEEICKAVGG